MIYAEWLCYRPFPLHFATLSFEAIDEHLLIQDAEASRLATPTTKWLAQTYISYFCFELSFISYYIARKGHCYSIEN